ncbi:tRNA dihydrouridine(20/20a) synthase DusA [Legionella sp. EUR-108]|uniref:tRNA-dihydrouridine synthase n=2 Tax=Legionella maioricensis TaxID=2896528 RepID=A0A9X2D0X7_9GAMM|nr:tRNA dihydrouridine(20/20a) synthase DusA [Legionella maioricensis]MCL9687153.1 tRNA dihydrouridine(20/20a) synthase DusA [Legionella maioricensis]
MIDWTYSHFRVLMRLLAPQALLYTEMQTTGAIHNNPKRALHFNEVEHPLAIQLGGSDPEALAKCAIIAEEAGYDEINLNLGCPSDKVQSGRFGACLMKEPEHVVQCIQAIKTAVTIPVTAKTRIGIDNQDSFEFFSFFAHQLVDAGCDKLIVHARKAWLSGLNPKQNRTIPPVNYDFVYRLKSEMPHIPIVINGNILNIKEINTHLDYVDGVMLGRLACDNPYYLTEIHQVLYPESPKLKRSQIFMHYLDYLIDEYSKGVPLSLLVKPIFNLAYGMPGASQWKKKLMAILQLKDLALFNDLRQYLWDMELIKENTLE